MAKFYKGDRTEGAVDASGGKPKYDIPGPKKAAIVLVAMGAEVSSEILKNMAEPEIEAITAHIARLEGVDAKMREAVLEEFHHLIMAKQFIAQGGVGYAEEILEAALGQRKAKEIMEKVSGSIRTTGFNMLDSVDPNQLLNFVSKEHPQTVAVLLAHMGSDKAARLLGQLPASMQVDVVGRIAVMESISPDVLHQVEQVLAQQMKSMFSGDATQIGGVKSVSEILNLTDISSQKAIITALERDDANLANEIKNLMFVFEDITLIDDRSMQKILREVDTKELPKALKGTSEAVTEKFLGNMSSRAAEGVREEIEFMGPIRLKEVEDAQQKIVDSIAKLIDEGTVQITGRGGDDEMVV
ncbi:flagellar motor switch protein FliG [Fibrobacterales bacterium]|nr:flagellar motor switch protein FliG [Fibrobacterales bacterium]